MSILERPLKFNQTANREEMSGGEYLALLIKTKQTSAFEHCITAQAWSSDRLQRGQNDSESCRPMPCHQAGENI